MDVRANNADVNLFGELSMAELEGLDYIFKRAASRLYEQDYSDSVRNTRNEMFLLADDVNIEIVRRML